MYSGGTLVYHIYAYFWPFVVSLFIFYAAGRTTTQ